MAMNKQIVKYKRFLQNNNKAIKQSSQTYGVSLGTDAP